MGIAVVVVVIGIVVVRVNIGDAGQVEVMNGVIGLGMERAPESRWVGG